MREMKKRVYVAGPYSATSTIETLRNIGRGEKMCAKLFKDGYAPFCPWHDMSYVIDLYDEDFNVEHFQEVGLSWLSVSQAMLLIGNWKSSEGTKAEVEFAKELDIPIYKSYGALKAADTVKLNA